MNTMRFLYGTVILVELSATALLAIQPDAISLFLFGHLTASLLLAVTAVRRTPADRVPSIAWQFAHGLFFFCIGFFVPVIGACICVALLGRPIPADAAKDGDMPVNLTESPALRNEIDATARRNYYAAVDMCGVLRQAKDKERRLATLIAARDLPARDAIALARLALTDPEDEVRLLAYTLLSVQEEKLQKHIDVLTKQLATAAPDCRLRFHKALAHTYWEAAYLGLSTGSMESFMLESAFQHAEAALRLAPLDPGLRLLLGRILLREGKLDQSALAFNQAGELGIALCKVTPFLNEVAFMQTRPELQFAATPQVPSARSSGSILVDAIEETRFHAGYRAAG
jgi:hypothetical protein